MNRKLNIKEFAEILGVSTATVSRAFSTKGRISEKTRRHIISKAEELGYHANIHARNLSSQKSNTVGLFYPSIDSDQPDYFVTEILNGIQNTLIKSNVFLQINPLPHMVSTDPCKDYIFSGGLGAVIIVAGSEESKKLVEISRSAGVPYIVVGHMAGESRFIASFDNAVGARQAGNYFLRTKRKHPAYIGGHLDKRKQNGFKKGLGEIAAELQIHPGGNSFQHGINAFNELIKKYPEVDCALCANDILSIGFIRAAVDAGYKIPEDIAVIGFDDLRFARYFTPSLSSISLNLHSLGVIAAKQVIKLLNNEEVNAEFIDCDLILRESS